MYADVEEIFRGVPKKALDVNLYQDVLRDLVRDKQYLGADFVVSSLHPLFAALPGFWTGLFDRIYYGKAPNNG